MLDESRLYSEIYYLYTIEGLRKYILKRTNYIKTHQVRVNYNIVW